MFENLKNIFKKNKKKELLRSNSKDAAKERLHLVLMQDRANVSADFLDLMRREIIEVIKKYIDIDEDAMDVRLTTETNEDGLQGAPALYANIPIINIKDETRKLSKTDKNEKVHVEPPNAELKEEKSNEENKENKEPKIEEVNKDIQENLKSKEEEIKENTKESNNEEEQTNEKDISKEESTNKNKSEEEKKETDTNI